MSHDDSDLLELLQPLDGQPGPAHPVSAGESSRAVNAVLDRSGMFGAQGEPERQVASGRGVRRRRLSAVGLVAVGVLSVTAAAAAVRYALFRVNEPAPSPVSVQVKPTNPNPARPKPDTTAPPVPTMAPTLEEPAAALVEDAPPERTTDPRRPRLRTPVDLLARANALRAERRWPEAARAYQLVYRKHSGSRQAVVATVAAASLRLEHLKDPRGALALYGRAVAEHGSGPLAAEARYGICKAYRALGDRSAEKRALEAFIRRHPQHLRRARAEERLSTL